MLTLVATPIGNIADITIRAMDALIGADVLLCEDTRVTKKLLRLLQDRYGKSLDKPQKFISLHSHNEQDFIDRVESSFFNESVVYVSDAGMPAVSDPGARLVRYCIDKGIEYDILPGASAFVTAYSASGFTDTKILFFGFLPHKGLDRKNALDKALHNGFVTLLYESPLRLIKLLKDIDESAPDRELFVAKELTKKFQNYYSGSAKMVLQELDGVNVRGEWVVVIDSHKSRDGSVGVEDILAASLPKKSAAKLISKITGESVKICYERLIQE